MIVEALQDDLSYLYSPAAVKASVELQLRRNGIPLSDSGSAVLLVNVNAIALANGRDVVYCLAMPFAQSVTLYITGAFHALARTWNVSSVGIVPRNEFVQTIRRSISDYVDIFSNDYLAMNPR